MLTIHSWDEISGEFDRTDLPDQDPDKADGNPLGVVDSWYEFIDYEPLPPETQIVLRLPAATTVVIKDGHGHVALCFWGDGSENLALAMAEDNS